MSRLSLHPSAPLCALLFITACSGEPPPKLSAQEVADLVTQKNAVDCPALQTADGWVESKTTEKTGVDLTYLNVEIIDRRARRTSSRKLNNPDREDRSFLAGATANGTSYGCFAVRSTHCTLAPLSQQPAGVGGPSDTTLAYVRFGDFDQPDHGGAAMAFDPAPSDVDDAVWKLSVTPKGGLPYILHVARDGTTLAIDLPGLRSRTENLDWQVFNGCRVPSETQLIMDGKIDKRSTVTNFEVRDTMAPTDTPTEGEVGMP